MFTKAAKQGIKAAFNWTTRNDAANSQAMFPNEPIKNTSGVDRWVSRLNGNLISHWNSVNNRYAGFCIGSGNTLPTENDYFLENQITTNFSMSIVDVRRGLDSNEKMYMEVNLVVVNTGSTNLVVREIGVVSNSIQTVASASATAAGNTDILIDRTILDTPITIEPTMAGAIIYRITSDNSFI